MNCISAQKVGKISNPNHKEENNLKTKSQINGEQREKDLINQETFQKTKQTKVKVI